jgi:trehalose 6-phosphate synthase
VIVVSHRGPYSFREGPDGRFEAKRGAGGVVSALGPLLSGKDCMWVAAALSDGDRAAVEAGAATAPGIDLQLIALDRHQHRMHYDVVSNGLLWFLYHGLLDLPRRPRLDRRFREAWEAYVGVNRAFADVVVQHAPQDAPVLVQDYQLTLVPAFLRRDRPDLRVVHFTHTPFCGPDAIRVLPDDVATALCASLAEVPAGFHTERWAASFTASATAVLGHPPSVSPFAATFGPDVEELTSIAGRDDVRDACHALDDLVGDRALIVRSDRVELSKNIARGFQAYDLLLEEHPEWHDRVVFVALLNPSREGLPEYLAYRQEVEQAADRVNERWGHGDWTPVVLDTRDDFARSVAGFVRYDVLLVNPIKDGLNLVAKEGPVVNENDGVLCLSREAGAFDDLGEHCIPVHPFDLVQTAGALLEALTMPREERRARAEKLRAVSSIPTPEDWLDAQLARASG